MTMDVMTRLLLQTAVSKSIKGEVDATRLLAAEELNPGDRRKIRAGTEVLGTVTMTDPTEVAEVDDESEFLAYVADHHISEVAARRQLKPGVRIEDVLAALHEFDEGLAADFAVEVPTVGEAFRKKLLAEVEGGKAVPGVVLVQRKSVLQVRPDAGALDRARQLLQGVAVPELGGAE